MKFIENLIVNSINFYRLIFSFNFFTETEYFSIVHCLRGILEKNNVFNLSFLNMITFFIHITRIKRNKKLFTLQFSSFHLFIFIAFVTK